MINYYIKILISLFCIGFFSIGNIIAQKNLNKKTKGIIEEGKTLYKSEMSSWYGTDIFLGNYEERENIHGYLSYTEGEYSKCIFFSNKEPNTRVIGTITFKGEYSIQAGKLDLQERGFTSLENSLYEIREKSFELLQSDTLFKYYENTNFNLIPLITKKERKVYILTGPKLNGVVVFGNDYLITFNKKNEVVSKKALHKNIIPIEYDENKKAEITMHSHLPETGDFITATDICTLMLYSKFAGWESHNVVSEKYLSQWDCKTNELNVISMKTIRKIDKIQNKN